MPIKRSLLSGLSWRAEARAACLAPEAGARMRNRCGHFMRRVGAHDSLPDAASRAAILCFHGIGAHRLDPDVEGNILPLRGFRQLLQVLHRSFRVISLAELVHCLQNRVRLPPKTTVITFDDGYANNHTIAAGELDALSMPWSEFVPALLIETNTWQWLDDVMVLIHRGSRQRLSLAWLNRGDPVDLSTREQRHQAVRAIQAQCRYVPDDVRLGRLAELYGLYSADEIESLRTRYPSFAPMTWGQVRELQSAGVDVGSHALTHTALGQQPPDAIRHEVFAARELLQQRIGDHSPHFSYPYGREAAISEASEAILAEAGYDCAVTLEQAVIDENTHNLLQLPRLIVSAQVGRTIFALWQRFVR